MKFSEKLKSLRTQANLTQTELAEKLIISRQAVSSYEQDRGYPSIDILVDISKFFSVSLDELLSTSIRKKHLKHIIISVVLLFFGNIINLLSVYFLRQTEPQVLLNLVFSIGVYIIPFMCLLIYVVFQCSPPKKINKFYGYRTKASMTNQLTWDYAQEYFSVVFAKIAILLFVLSILYIALTLFVNLNTVWISGCMLLGLQALSLFAPIYFTERKLKIFREKN